MLNKVYFYTFKIKKVTRIKLKDFRKKNINFRFKKTPADQAVLKNLPLKLVVVQCGQKYEISVHDINALPDQDKMPSLQKELQDIGKSLFFQIFTRCQLL